MDSEFDLKESVRVVAIQSAFFWQGLDMSQPLVLARQINESLGPILDGEPAVLPPPKNVPPVAGNFPRIILSTKDGKYKCNVGAARADIVFAEQSPEPPNLMAIWEKYSKIIQCFVAYIKDKSPAVVTRLGILFRLFRKLDLSGNEYVRKNFLQEKITETPFETHLNMLHRQRMDRFGINRWVRLRSLRNKENPEDDHALMMEVDINTLQEEQHPFVEYEMSRFFETAYEHLLNEDIKYLLIE